MTALAAFVDASFSLPVGYIRHHADCEAPFPLAELPNRHANHMQVSVELRQVCWKVAKSDGYSRCGTCGTICHTSCYGVYDSTGADAVAPIFECDLCSAGTSLWV